jgi:hypothetical protein
MLLTGQGPLTAGTTRTLPLLNPAEDRVQRQRPKGVVIDRSERKGWFAESLFWATLGAGCGGCWWREVRIEPGVKYVSALSQSEVLSSFEVGCMCVAHNWVTCEASDSSQKPCCTPAVWRRWYRRPKQRNSGTVPQRTLGYSLRPRLEANCGGGGGGSDDCGGGGGGEGGSR